MNDRINQIYKIMEICKFQVPFFADTQLYFVDEGFLLTKQLFHRSKTCVLYELIYKLILTRFYFNLVFFFVKKEMSQSPTIYFNGQFSMYAKHAITYTQYACKAQREQLSLPESSLDSCEQQQTTALQAEEKYVDLVLFISLAQCRHLYLSYHILLVM